MERTITNPMRYQDWPLRLEQAIAAHQGRRFRYGRMDCVRFAAECVKAMTGEDYIKPWRGRYESKTEAEALLRDAGGLQEAATSMLGPEIPVNLAKRGDVLLFDFDGGSLGICMGAKAAVCARSRGVTFIRARDAIAAWSV